MQYYERKPLYLLFSLVQVNTFCSDKAFGKPEMTVFVFFVHMRHCLGYNIR